MSLTTLGTSGVNEIILSEIRDVNCMVMTMDAAKNILGAHLEVLMDSASQLGDIDDREDVMRNCYLIAEVMDVDGFFDRSIDKGMDLWGNEVFGVLKGSGDQKLRGIVEKKLSVI